MINWLRRPRLTAIAPPEKTISTPALSAYGGGGFRVGGQWFQGDILILPREIRLWQRPAAAILDAAAFAPFLTPDAANDLIIFGYGAVADDIVALRHLYQDLEAQGLTIEIMTTGAACRVWNMLIAENRAVAAALIAIP